MFKLILDSTVKYCFISLHFLNTVGSFSTFVAEFKIIPQDCKHQITFIRRSNVWKKEQIINIIVIDFLFLPLYLFLFLSPHKYKHSYIYI